MVKLPQNGALKIVVLRLNCRKPFHRVERHVTTGSKTIGKTSNNLSLKSPAAYANAPACFR